MKKVYPLLFCGILSLAACGQSEQTNTATNTDASSSQSAVANSAPAETKDNQSDRFVIPENAQIIEISDANPSYWDTLLHIWVAQMTTPIRVDDITGITTALTTFRDEAELNQFILSSLSPEYTLEKDRFKLQDMEKQLLPQFKQKLEAYKGDYILRIPFNVDTNSDSIIYKKRDKEANQSIQVAVTSTTPSISEYNFDTQSFMLNPIELYSIGMEYVNTQYAPTIHMKPSRNNWKPFDPEAFDKFRTIVMTERNQAQAFEAANNSRKLGQRGYMDYYIKDAELHPVTTKVEYFNVETGEVYLTKELDYKQFY